MSTPSKNSEVKLINIYALDPSDVVKENVLDSADDTVVDADSDVVVPGFEEDLAEEEAELMSLRALQVKSLEANFPTQEMRKLAENKVKIDQTNRNRSISRKMLKASSSTKKKNEKLLFALNMILVMIKRCQKNIPITTMQDKLSTVKVKNIPDFSTMKARHALFNEVFKCVVNGKSIMKEPVKNEKDLGPSLKKMIKICDISKMVYREGKGFESYSGSPIFDYKSYSAVSKDLKSAGYHVQDLFQFVKNIDNISACLNGSGFVFDGYTEVDEKEIEDLMVHHDFTDTVDMVDAAQTRRLRFSALQNLRSQILVDALVQDSATILRILQGIESQLLVDNLIRTSEDTNNQVNR